MAVVLDGKALAKAERAGLVPRIEALRERGVVPGIAVVLVGEDPASAVYVRNKERAAKKIGIVSHLHRLPKETSERALIDLVLGLNADDGVHGILVQLPLPAHMDELHILDSIRPHKDVDGFHPDNIGRLAQGRPRFVAATPRGCMRLLAESGVELAGASAVVIGRSNIVGKPMAMLLTKANATVTLCHSRTRDLPDRVRAADIVVAAVGHPGFVRGEWIKPGAVVIDVGINRMDDGSLAGDVEYAEAFARARAITPVPGGVGPMTIASLLANTVDAAERAVSAG